MAEVKVTEESKFVRLVAKLIRLTQEGQLTWSPVAKWGNRFHRRTGGDQDVHIDLGYTTEYADERLVLYRLLIESAIKIDPSLPASTIVQLGPADSEGHTTYLFPQTRALFDLYNAVAYQVANVGRFLDRASEGE